MLEDLTYETKTYEVLKFNIQNHLNQRKLQLANVDLDTYLDHFGQDLVIRMTASILALPEEKIVVNEVVYDKWYHHLIDSFNLLKYLLGEPPKREIKIDKQIYSDIKTDFAIPDDRSYVNMIGMKNECRS